MGAYMPRRCPNNCVIRQYLAVVLLLVGMNTAISAQPTGSAPAAVQQPAVSAGDVAQGSVTPQVQHLIDNLGSKPSIARTQTISTLGSLGPAAAPAIPALVDILKSRSEMWQVRALAAHTLGQVGPVGTAAIDPLIVAISDRYSNVRREAVTALGAILNGAAEPTVKPVVDALIGKANDRKEIVDATISSLKHIGPNIAPRRVRKLGPWGYAASR